VRNSGVYEYSTLEEIVDIRLGSVGSVGVFVIEVGILSIKEMQEVRVPMNLPAGRNLHYASKSLRELIILLATGQFSKIANGSSLSGMQCSRRALP
jgi:hypothetical protein